MQAAKLKRHSNGVWYITWTEGRRSKRTTTLTRDVTQAQLAFAHWLQVRNGGQRATALPGTTLKRRQRPHTTCALHVDGLWQAYWVGHVEPNVVAKKSLGYAWANLKCFFADLPLSKVNQKAAERYLGRRLRGSIGRPAKPQTVRRELVSLVAALNWCASPGQEIIEPSDVPRLKHPPEGPPRDRWLRAEEKELLFEAAERLREGDRLSRVERFMWIAVETAARKTAIIDLTWDRVHFDVGVIHFDIPGRKQTKKRRANVAISIALRPVLERAFRERQNNLVLDNMGDIWPALQRVAGAAGFKASRPRSTKFGKPRAVGISPNVFRHTAGTLMARAGVPLWNIGKVMGNSHQMVDRVYAKWTVGDTRAAVNAITPKKATHPAAPQKEQREASSIALHDEDDG